MASSAALPTETVQHCPLCGSERQRLFDRRRCQDHLVINQLCQNCGLVFQSPRMTAAALETFYERDYRTLYQGWEGPSRKDLVVQHGRAEFLLSFIKSRIPAPGRHLDIGASAGILMSRFRSQFDGDAYGVEPGTAYLHYAQSQGLAVYPSIDELNRVEKEPFDLISMAHVLEHLPDPAGYLEILRMNYLTEGGWLLIEVPNLYTHDCFEIAHLACFSPHTLRQVLQKAGFQIDYLLQHGHPRSVVLPLYLTLLARPDVGSSSTKPYVIQGEKAVALKRRYGMGRRRLLQRLFPSLAWLPMP